LRESENATTECPGTIQSTFLPHTAHLAGKGQSLIVGFKFT